MSNSKRPFLAVSLLALAAGCGTDEIATDDPHARLETPAAAPDTVQTQPASRELLTLASFPAGTFLENMDRLPDGDLVVTSYFDKKLLRVTESGDVSTLAQLIDHPVGVLVVEDALIVSVQGAPFSDAPDFMDTNAVAIFGLDGETRAKTAAPEARFLNGLHLLPDGTVLVADSIIGVLWAVDKTSGALSLWARAEELGIDPDNPAFLPGANGVKTFGGALYVSNSSKGAIFKRPLGSDGGFERHATTGAVDDFAIAADGTIYATTHGAALLKVAPDGVVSALIEDGCDGCTSVLFSNNGDRLIVANDGNLFEGAPGETRIFAVAID
ncbi:MAG: hypothetical protein AAFQ67_08910 [Pseudomonadota bacterium]